MEKIKIEGDRRRPSVNFDPALGTLEIRGRSTTENSLAFYKPLHEWVSQYRERPAENTTINIGLEYFNTSTSRWLYKILKALEPGNNVKVNWYYSDEDILDAGEDMKAILDIPFSMIKE